MGRPEQLSHNPQTVNSFPARGWWRVASRAPRQSSRTTSLPPSAEVPPCGPDGMVLAGLVLPRVSGRGRSPFGQHDVEHPVQVGPVWALEGAQADHRPAVEGSSSYGSPWKWSSVSSTPAAGWLTSRCMWAGGGGLAP